MTKERTIVLVKPDAVQRGLVGKILERFEQKGLKIAGLKMIKVSEAILHEHYAHIADKPFFGDLKKFMMSSPVVVLCLEGLEAVGAVRKVCGVTKSRDAEGGTIRGDFGMGYGANIVHTSENLKDAEAEVKRFFPDEKELFDYKRSDFEQVYATETDGRQ